MSLSTILQIYTAATQATPDLTKAIKLPEIANESTVFVASLLMDIVHTVCRWFGLQHDATAINIFYIALVIIIGIAVGDAVKWLMLFLVRKISKHIGHKTMQDMIDGNFFSKISLIIPPLVMLLLMQFALTRNNHLILWIEKGLWIYILCCIAISINTLIYVIWLHIDERENKKRLPLKGIVQVVKALIWFMVLIIAIAIIVNKSPAALLAGLGAFAAVLMLVFKDSILGVVAGVQLAENDMLRVGDWIKVDGTSANGNVIEVSLTSVKVLNWDKTITTLPPYSLVSASFQNYRPMQESNTRRIQRWYFIDADTVRPCTPQLLEEFKQIPFMKDYIEKKQAQAAAGKVQNVNNSEGLADGSIDTNLGLLRAYLKMYLDNNPHISHADTCFVNTLQQTGGGIPVQLYCFTSTSAWIPYEGIQSEIFEHISAILPLFHLYAFENPSSRDTVNEGYLEASGNPAYLYSLPYPFMPGTDGVPGTSPFAAPQK